MKVCVKMAHDNGYGDRWSKKPGDHYDLPDDAAATLIEAGLIVELKGDRPARAARKRTPRTAAQPVANTGQHANDLQD